MNKTYFGIQCRIYIFDLGNIVAWRRFEVVNFDIFPVEKNNSIYFVLVVHIYHIQCYM